MSLERERKSCELLLKTGADHLVMTIIIAVSIGPKLPTVLHLFPQDSCKKKWNEQNKQLQNKKEQESMWIISPDRQNWCNIDL